MDDHILPLDLTIYGAIHQHELRKKAAGVPSSLPPSLLWQGIYTVKFKKVPGPAPTSSPDGTFISLNRRELPTDETCRPSGRCGVVKEQITDAFVIISS